MTDAPRPPRPRRRRLSAPVKRYETPSLRNGESWHNLCDRCRNWIQGGPAGLREHRTHVCPDEPARTGAQLASRSSAPFGTRPRPARTRRMDGPAPRLTIPKLEPGEFWTTTCECGVWVQGGPFMLAHHRKIVCQPEQDTDSAADPAAAP